MDQKDYLKCLSVDQFSDLKSAFKADWPRGITGYYALDTLEKWMKQGIDYGFKVLNPFGDPKNGMIAVIKDEKTFIEMLIECPQDDTSKLEEAFIQTQLIERNREIVILFPHKHVLECVRRIAPNINMIVEWVRPLELYVLDKNSDLFDVSLPQGFKFSLLTEDYIDLADSTWPHRYPGSTKYFQLLIRSKSGYGLFKDDKLISFGFVKEMGALGHLFTLEEYRRRGYGEIVTKLICNEVLKRGCDVFSFCIQENLQSCRMHEKIGFKKLSEVFAIGLKPQ